MKVRAIFFNQWASALERADAYLARVSGMDLSRFVTDPRDAALMKMARLDCDWYAANARCFATLRGEGIEFLPAYVTGKAGLVELAQMPPDFDEERWLITMAQQPQMLGAEAGKIFDLLSKLGVRHLYYAFDEASRSMPCFTQIAPSLDVLIHDEAPLDPRGAAALRPGCVTRHRSWVANFTPGEADFNEAPERKIFFLGSQLGLTPHRQRQIEFLRQRFKDRFVCRTDHSLPVNARRELSRYQVGLCPEGRKFTTPAMSLTHTDRPFWCGCLGMVPVSEDSASGGRLEELRAAGLIVSYAHADTAALAEACERALEFTSEQRRRIYEHFNAHETIGAVVTEALLAVGHGEPAFAERAWL